MNIARRTLYLSSMMLIAIMLVGFTSCASEDFFLEEGGKSLSLQVATTGQAQTRSDGEEDLNENLLSRLDYFFFKADANNNATGTLVHHITETNQTSQIDHEYSSGLSDELLTGLFGSTTPADRLYCYVYVVVNYDGFTNDNITVGSTTLADIQNITFSTTLSTNAAQPSFVMAGGSPVQLRIINGSYYRLATSRPIPVTRAAAKIDLTVYDVQPYTDPDPNDGSRWKSHPENMYVMFYNGVSKSYIYADAGHYITTPENSDYFSVRGSNMRQMTETATGSGRYEHAIPFYSYMSNWNSDADRMSCLILVLPWEHVDSNGQPMSDGYQSTYYQIPTSLDKRYLENHYYQIEVMIGMIGSFEEPTPVILEDNTYMVVDWGTVSEEAAVRESKYLIVEANQYTMNNVETASVPYITSHDLEYAYVSSVKYETFKSFTETTVQNNNNPSLNGTWTTTINNKNETFSVNSENGVISLSHTIHPQQYTPYEVTVKVKNKAVDEPETIVFIIYPAIYADTETGGDVFINGYFGHVSNPVSQDNNGWIQNNDGSYRVRYNNNNNNTIWAGGQPDNANANTSYGSLVTTSPDLDQTVLTRIKVTSFSEEDATFTISGYEYTYKLTDPRVPSGWSNNDLNDYLETESSYYYRRNNRNYSNYTNKEWTSENNADASKIMVGTSDRDKIAPEFIIMSSWGRCNPNNLTFENAKKRCATYQEAGYPAGRWRLPTMAEVSYIYTLQNRNVINNLFNARHNDGYWVSDGTRINANGISTTSTTTTSLRCVYDVWYWGENDDNTNTGVYNPKP